MKQDNSYNTTQQIPNQNIGMQQPMNQMPNQQLNSTQQPSIEIVNNNALLEAYIGKNFNKIITRKFNFSGLLFTTTYMAYRGMYIYAILYFVIAWLFCKSTSTKTYISTSSRFIC